MINSPDIGSYFILRANEPVLTKSFKKILEELRPIGIHFAKEAFREELEYQEWLDTYSKLREDIQQATGRKKMIWALDHEGGRVHRLPTPITKLPYPLNWEERSAEVGDLVGTELHSLGINLLFGPSLDIYSNEQNKVIGPRAFGRTAEAVEKFALPYIAAVQQHGVRCVAKHFPGHGDTFEDTHFELPTLSLSKEDLYSRELKPFAAAILNSISAIMLAHIIFPDLDPTLPSSLTPSIATDLLRTELGFTGVSITDDLDMHAIANNFKPSAIAHAFATAGIDLTIFNHHPDRAVAVAEHLAPLLTTENGHRQRIEKLLQQMDHSAPSPLFKETLAKHSAICTSLHEQYSLDIKEFTGD